MRVNEAVEITKGHLLASPLIREFERISTKIAHIQKGDLFIANNAIEASMATNAGAYGVICEKPCEPNDKESAWIEVDNIKDAIIRIIRYKLLARNIALVSLSPVQEAIAKNIIHDERVAFFSSDLRGLLELLNDTNIKFIVTSNEEILALSFEIINSSKPIKNPFLMLSHTLFDSTIFYKSAHYRLNLPMLFLNDLGSVVNLCEQKSFSFDIANFKHIPFFKPNFLNALGKLIEYGQASKVAIAEDNIEQFKKYMAYIANNATWGKILFLVPTIYVDLFSEVAQTYAYESEEELCEHIRNENFNFALILGIDDDSLVDALKATHKPLLEPSLFAGLFDEQ